MADLDGGVELIVGCVRDPRFGPVLMVGLGGVFAEVLGDTAVALAPVSRDGARTLLPRCAARRCSPAPGAARRSTSTRSRTWWPGSPRVAAAHPELAELELNPVLADARRGARPRRARRTGRVGSGLDVAQVALVERVDPGVLGREDAVVERA